MLRLSKSIISDKWVGIYESQAMMMKIKDCINCGKCMTKCPYGLNIPKLLKKNLADYEKILSGEISVKTNDVRN